MKRVQLVLLTGVLIAACHVFDHFCSQSEWLLILCNDGNLSFRFLNKEYRLSAKGINRLSSENAAIP